MNEILLYEDSKIVFKIILCVAMCSLVMCSYPCDLIGLTGVSAILSQLPRHQELQTPSVHENISLLGSIAPQTSPRSLEFLSGILQQAVLNNQDIQQINRNLVGAFTLSPVF